MTNNELIEIINYIEDKDITIQSSWFFHGTDPEIETIEKILKEGIKCSYLRGDKSKGGYNGKYYVSVSKILNTPNRSVYKLFEHLPIFVLDNIKPIPANKNSFLADYFIDTIIPIRCSSYEGEYHSFLKIDHSKIIALGYNLYHLLSPNYKLDTEKLEFLRQIVLYIEKINLDLPIYDLTSKKEINKEKVRSLKLN